MFEPVVLVPTQVDKSPYSHGFTQEEVLYIKANFTLLEKRDKTKEPVTLEEFKNIVIPACRINRTEEFILNPPKVKKVAKLPKLPKLTKKAIRERLEVIILKKVQGKEVTEEEDSFFIEHSPRIS